MKLLIDATILLDVLQAREPHMKNSSLIWKLCETGEVDGYVSALTLANLVYVMRKELDPKDIHNDLKNYNWFFILLRCLKLISNLHLRWSGKTLRMQYSVQPQRGSMQILLLPITLKIFYRAGKR